MEMPEQKKRCRIERNPLLGHDVKRVFVGGAGEEG